MAVISPPQLREPSYPGFPPRCGMTFGEVVSAYNMFGNTAAKRHNYMIHHQETHLPDDRCTIHEKVMCLPKDKDLLKSVSSSSRGMLTPRWSATARSRTPSPYALARRPRSLPGTPRAATPNGLRRSDSRDRYLKEPVDVGGVLYDSHGRVEPARYGGGGLDTFAVENFTADTFATAADGGRSRGIASNLAAAAPLAPALPGTGALGSQPAASIADSAGAVGAGVPPYRTPSTQAKGGGGGYERFSSRGGGVGYSRFQAESFGRAPSQADARATSFVRLNSFLLRTHVTSLVSALAEDGWLEGWEKERLCSQAREDSPAWAQSFFRVYMRFMETEDVPAFVASLRSQIV